MGDSYLDRIGDRFKELRKEKNLTLKELSEKTGLSIGYLSNLERNISSPTLEYMQRICEILGVSITELLAPEKQEHILIRKADRVTLIDNDNLKCESINFGNYDTECLCITLHPGVSFHETWGHAYDEMGIVVQGSMEITIDEKIYTLYEGDSFYICANTPHSMSNSSEEDCISYWVMKKS